MENDVPLYAVGSQSAAYPDPEARAVTGPAAASALPTQAAGARAGQHLAKLRRLASLRDQLDDRRGQEGQPNEASDVAHPDPFLRRNFGER